MPPFVGKVNPEVYASLIVELRKVVREEIAAVVLVA